MSKLLSFIIVIPTKLVVNELFLDEMDIVDNKISFGIMGNESDKIFLFFYLNFLKLLYILVKLYLILKFLILVRSFKAVIIFALLA